jgi:CBS domain-containing protein
MQVAWARHTFGWGRGQGQEKTMLTVEELMNRKVITLEADASLIQVDDLMKSHHIRHVPVVQGRKLVGLVSHRDLIRALARQSSGKSPPFLGVQEVMTREVETVSPQASVRAAIDKLLEKRFGCLPVVDAQGELVGIVTESDFLRLARRMLTERGQRVDGFEPAPPSPH